MANQTATFGAGCFWCVEAIFQRVDGVDEVRSGYMGGETENPTYESVCSGQTGHAEVVQVRFNPDRVSYRHLLDIFLHSHNPTTLNRQGADVGTQYRSAIFYHSDEQREIAEAMKAELEDNGRFPEPIVTEIVPAKEFYPAEAYHQDYYNRNAAAPYCQTVILPKLSKLGMQ